MSDRDVQANEALRLWLELQLSTFPWLGRAVDPFAALFTPTEQANALAASIMPLAGVAVPGANVAKSAANAIRLAKELASQAQMGEAGTVIAGPGSRALLSDAPRLARQYGGKVTDWVKKTSSSFVSRDGTRFETHWYENLNTGERLEVKTTLTGGY